MEINDLRIQDVDLILLQESTTNNNLSKSQVSLRPFMSPQSSNSLAKQKFTVLKDKVRAKRKFYETAGISTVAFQNKVNFINLFSKNHKRQLETALIGRGNNSQLIKRIIQKNKKIHLTTEISQSTKIVWTQIYQIELEKSRKNGYAFWKHNHIFNNHLLGNKKSLFLILSKVYCPFQLTFIPKTFLIRPENRRDWSQFMMSSAELRISNWIIKPGENSNRGNGISVCSRIQQIRQIILKEKQLQKSFIVQQYIKRPLLFKGRKFDIRVFMVCFANPMLFQVFWFKQGYIRTSSEMYEAKSSKVMVHLTNDAVQKNCKNYGKFQPANKVSFSKMSQFIERRGGNFRLIRQQMKQIGRKVIMAASQSLQTQKNIDNFQIFGLDFLILENYEAMLLEVNTNPCLQTPCPLLSRLISTLVESTLDYAMQRRMSINLQFIYKKVNE